MAGDHLSPSRGPAPVDTYLSELASRLRGPRRRRAQILAELRDGLQHAIDGHLAQGRSPAEATTAAIACFGTPKAVAGAFAGELATAHARRTIAAYVATGPLVGIWWMLLLQPYPWRSGLLSMLAAIPVIPLIGVVLATAAATLATTGSMIRWLPETQPGRALLATLAIAVLVLAADVTVVVIFLRSDIPAHALAVLACAASLTRIAGGVLVIRHTIAARRSLHTSSAASVWPLADPDEPGGC